MRVHPEEVHVEPGSVLEVDVLVTNLTPVVEIYRFEVLGMPGGAYFDPGEVSLLPDEDGRATGHLTVSIDAPLGEVRAAVRAVGETSGSVSAADLRLVVGDRADIEVALRPPTSQGYRTGKHTLSLTNNGTLPTSVELAAVGDTPDAVTVKVPATANIDTGESRDLPVVVKTRRRPDRGERFGFTVSVHHGAQTTVLPGLLQSGGRPLKPWLIGGAAGLLVLLLIAFLLVRSDDDGSNLAAVENPSTTRIFLDTGVTTLPPPIEATTTIPPPTSFVTFPPPVISAPPVIPPATPPQTAPATTQAPTTTTIPRPPSQSALAEEVYRAWRANNVNRLNELAVPEVVQRLQMHTLKGVGGQGFLNYGSCNASEPADYTPDDAGNCVKANLGGCTEQGSGAGLEFVEVIGDSSQTFRAADFKPCP